MSERLKALIVKGLKELGFEVAKSAGEKIVQIATEAQAGARQGSVGEADRFDRKKSVGL